ncbi:MAG: isochorismatase family protein [Nitrospirae bacterium]|nr:isochorismatase family protein [Nitrospirota bacterium]
MAVPLMLPTPRDTVVVVIDAQERLMPAMHADLRDRALKHMQALLKASAVHQVPVVCTEQYPKGLGATLPEIRSLMEPYDPIVKTAFSCCDVEPFTRKLESLNRPNIAVMGMETHVCVYQTVVGLLQRGYKPLLLSDAVCSRKMIDYETSVEQMREDGATISTTETLLFSWTREAGSEAFKKISLIVRDLS